MSKPAQPQSPPQPRAYNHQHLLTHRKLYPEFVAEVARMGGNTLGASKWLEETIATGIEPDDTAVSLAWMCVDEERDRLDLRDPEQRARYRYLTYTLNESVQRDAEKELDDE